MSLGSKEQLLRNEISVLNERAESRASEITRLQGLVERYKASYEEVEHALKVTSKDVDGETFANATRELERNRKQYETQHADFENIKKSLMKDLQNRCEKVRSLIAAES
jgi:kinesin family protein 5